MVERRTTLQRLALSTVLLASMVGCGDKKFASVNGTITFDGQPLDGARIVFAPETPEGEFARAISHKDGTFRLGTDKAEGVPPGTYRVIVEKFDLSPNVKKNTQGKRRGKQSVLPSHYANEKTTPLHCTIPHEGPVLLELKSK